MGVDEQAREQRARRAFESRREREFYSYYHPILALSEKPPSLCDLHNARSVAEHRPSSSPDKALTAFAQLAAIRLETRRAMLFFFDEEYAYVLAEATRSLSLQDDEHHARDDGLWLGSTKIPRGFSVCEVTTEVVPPANRNAKDSESEPTAYPVAHIINDLRGDVRFCDRPFVVGGPLARFYAGVPITTPRGINIGAFCVLDDKPREGLPESDVRFLRDMAAVTMEHLEMVRARAENQWSRNMTTGLGAFMQSRRSDVDSTSYSSEPPKPALGNVSKDDGIGEHDFAVNQSADGVRGMTEQLREAHFTSGVQTTMKRAAGLLREAMSLDGVAFLDARVGSFGGRVNGSQGLPETEGSTDMSAPEREFAAHPTAKRREARKPPSTASIDASRFCPVLAVSSGPEDHKTGKRGPIRYSEVQETFLRSLLRRYPLGRIWNFNKEGDASADDFSDAGLSSASGASSYESDQEQVIAKTSQRPAKSRRTILRDGRAIQRLFPGVRSLAIIGMWDSQKELWFAGLIVWSFSPTRLLSHFTELPFLNAFGEVVLAEVLRIEALMVDRSKNNFVASISHELRSPLHGILGCAEALQERDYDQTTNEMISSIIACGTSLLEIINGLLDFSLIDDVPAVGPLFNPAALQKTNTALPSVPRQHTAGSLLAQETGIALDILIEKEVENACSAHAAHIEMEHEKHSGRDVVVAVDVDRTANWTFNMAASAWRKICTNLVANALKFTKTGYITVSLRQVKTDNVDEQDDCTSVELKVEDSGVGITKAFQSQGLFRAFRQEDPLTEGTGLGLNLVAKIVKSQGGTVHLTSDKDVGTVVTVILPLDAAHFGRETVVADRPGSRWPASTLLALVGFDNPLDSPEHAPVVKALQRPLASLQEIASSLKLRTCIGDCADAHVLLCSERQLQAMSDAADERPLLVLFSSRRSAEQFKSSGHAKRPGRNIHHIWQPISPAKIARAVSWCLERRVPVAHHSAQQPDSTTPPMSSRQIMIETEEPDVVASLLTTPEQRDLIGGNILFPTQGTTTLVEQGGVHQPALPRGYTTRPLPVRLHSDSQLESRIAEIASANTASTIRAAVNHASPQSPQGEGLHRTVSPRISAENASLTLLLVDDNSINLQLLVAYAKKGRHRYLTAQNGLEAVQAYRNSLEDTPSFDSSHVTGKSLRIVDDHIFAIPERPSVVLMDINMPVMDGFEATRNIRELERIHNVSTPCQIVALTGQASAEARLEAYTSGMDLFLTKPVRLKELKSIIDDVARV